MKEIEDITITEILERNGIDYINIEKNNQVGWYELNTPISIPTHRGDSRITKVYYNGEVESLNIIFDNMSSEICTSEHKFKAYPDESWIKAGDLKPGDNIISVDGCGYTSVENITSAGKHHTWDLNVLDVHEYILDSGVVTHNSGTAIGVHGSIEPILDFSYEVEGSISGTVMVPEFNTLNQYYEKAYDIPQEILTLHAAIRQLWIDQAQSFGTFIAPENWSYQYMMMLHMLAEKLGVKTSYYVTTPKQDADEICDTCGV